MQLIRVLLLAFLLTPAAVRGAVLRHQFKQDQQHRYSLNLDIALKGEILNRKAEATLWVKGEVAIKTIELLPEDQAKIALTFPWLAFELKLPAPVEGVYGYDSRGSVPQTPADKQIAEWFGKFLKQQTVLTVDTRGNIKNVLLPPLVLDGMGANRNKPEAEGGLGTEEGLVSFLKQMDFTLPEEDAAPGAEWTKLLRLQTPIGVLGLDLKNTYRGLNGWGMERIEVTPVMSLQDGRALVPLNLKIRGQEGEGEVLFNQKLGCFESMTLEHTVHADLTILGQESRGSLEVTVEMERLED